ncbi:F0F1 ATP synthase subunit A [Tautonia sp. JC769]|uniref:F0F1 ATP synthase subunit A n=1 Tax=Tautonia sp. JC769 TaxID=3232135 RepID=UPI00345A38F3
MADEHAHEHSPLDHVIDHPTLEVPFVGELDLPMVFGIQVTRFMVMETIAALLLLAVFIPLARHAARQQVTRGRFLNMFESVLVFIRDKMARPAIGHHHADQFLPYLWTVFFFVLLCNLLGMIPGGASATGNINVTATLALMTLGAVVVAGVKEMGPVGFLTNLVPHMDVPWIMKPILWPLMFVIEVAGLFIRHVVLSVRLFANMLAGHIVLAVILGFTLTVSQAALYIKGPVIAASVGGVVLLSLLELFVAFLQAYIFTFLSALFIGAAVHSH